MGAVDSDRSVEKNKSYKKIAICTIIIGFFIIVNLVTHSIELNHSLNRKASTKIATSSIQCFVNGAIGKKFY